MRGYSSGARRYIPHLFRRLDGGGKFLQNTESHGDGKCSHFLECQRRLFRNGVKRGVQPVLRKQIFGVRQHEIRNFHRPRHAVGIRQVGKSRKVRPAKQFYPFAVLAKRRVQPPKIFFVLVVERDFCRFFHFARVFCGAHILAAPFGRRHNLGKSARLCGELIFVERLAKALAAHGLDKQIQNDEKDGDSARNGIFHAPIIDFLRDFMLALCRTRRRRHSTA